MAERQRAAAAAERQAAQERQQQQQQAEQERWERQRREQAERWQAEQDEQDRQQAAAERRAAVRAALTSPAARRIAVGTAAGIVVVFAVHQVLGVPLGGWVLYLAVAFAIVVLLWHGCREGAALLEQQAAPRGRTHVAVRDHWKRGPDGTPPQVRAHPRAGRAAAPPWHGTNRLPSPGPPPAATGERGPGDAAGVAPGAGIVAVWTASRRRPELLELEPGAPPAAGPPGGGWAAGRRHRAAAEPARRGAPVRRVGRGDRRRGPGRRRRPPPHLTRTAGLRPRVAAPRVYLAGRAAAA